MTDKKSTKRGAIERLRGLEAYRITNDAIVEALLSPEMLRSFDDRNWGIDEWNERVVSYIIDLLLDDGSPSCAVVDMNGATVSIGDVVYDPVTHAEFPVHAYITTADGVYLTNSDMTLVCSPKAVRRMDESVVWMLSNLLIDYGVNPYEDAKAAASVAEYAKRLQMREDDDGC